METLYAVVSEGVCEGVSGVSEGISKNLCGSPKTSIHVKRGSEIANF